MRTAWRLRERVAFLARRPDADSLARAKYGKRLKSGWGASCGESILDRGEDCAGHGRLAEEFGGECFPLPADISKLDGIEALASTLAERESQLDILVNNAGATWGAPVDEFPEVGWDKVMDTNVKGVFFLTQKLLPLLRKSASYEDPARIINVGSVDGIKTPVFDNFSYGPSKAAVHHLTRVMASHLVKENILVNGIAPGPFPTWMLSAGLGFGGDVEGQDWDSVGQITPRGRVGTLEDIAGVAIFLSSRAGSYTVGDIITCDGGVVAAS